MQTLSEKAVRSLHQLNCHWQKIDWQDRDCDELHSLHNGMEIRLAVPNGGIIAVSVWDKQRQIGWSLMTEFLPNHEPSWYHDKDFHAQIGQQAICALRKILKPYSKRRRKPQFGSPEQLNLLSLEPQPELESAPLPTCEITTCEKNTSKPKHPFAVGDMVCCNKELTSGPKSDNRPFLPWGGRSGVVERFEYGRVYVKYGDWPPYPHLPDAMVRAEQGNAGERPANIFKEWRYWANKGLWSYTGLMGMNIKPRFCNSQIFPAGVNPNDIQKTIES